VHPAAVRLQLLALVEEVHTTAGRPALDLNYGTKFSVRWCGLERPALDLTARPAFCTPARIGAAEAHIADRASCKSSSATHHVGKTTERITY
jgi:hypothetical protein